MRRTAESQAPINPENNSHDARQTHHETETARGRSRKPPADVGGHDRQPDVLRGHLATADEVLVKPGLTPLKEEADTEHRREVHAD